MTKQTDRAAPAPTIKRMASVLTHVRAVLERVEGWDTKDSGLPMNQVGQVNRVWSALEDCISEIEDAVNEYEVLEHQRTIDATKAKAAKALEALQRAGMNMDEIRALIGKGEEA